MPPFASIIRRIPPWTRSSDQPVGIRSASFFAKWLPIVCKRLYGVSMLPQFSVMNEMCEARSVRRWMSYRTWATTAVFPVPILP